jgi:Ankyrin repeats (3 copies)
VFLLPLLEEGKSKSSRTKIMGWKEFFSSPQTARRAPVQVPLGPLAEKTFLKGNDRDVLDWVQRHPESCHQKLKIKGLGEVSPLTIVCRKRLSLETIQAVHLAYPKALVEDPSLHHALAHQATLDVVKYLVTENPESIFSKKGALLPLHRACRNQPSLQVVEYLYHCYPEAIQTPCGSEGFLSKLPLHLAIEKGASLEVIEFLLAKYPQAIEKADYVVDSIKTQDRGYFMHKVQYNRNVSYDESFYWDTACGLPLHLAAAYKAPLAVLRVLYKAYPTALITKNKNGFLPLHCAIQKSAPLTTISYLGTLQPETMTEPTIENYTSPIQLATKYNGWQTNLKTIQFLLSSRPAVQGVAPPTRLYDTYLDDALEHGASQQLIYFLDRVVRASEQGYSYVRTFEV